MHSRSRMALFGVALLSTLIFSICTLLLSPHAHAASSVLGKQTSVLTHSNLEPKPGEKSYDRGYRTGYREGMADCSSHHDASQRQSHKQARMHSHRGSEYNENFEMGYSRGFDDAYDSCASKHMGSHSR